MSNVVIVKDFMNKKKTSEIVAGLRAVALDSGLSRDDAERFIELIRPIVDIMNSFAPEIPKITGQENGEEITFNLKDFELWVSNIGAKVDSEFNKINTSLYTCLIERFILNHPE